MQNEAIKKSEQESRSRCEWAENECTKMAQQLVNIRDSSEEVAFLEAEEVSDIRASFNWLLRSLSLAEKKYQ